MDLKLRGMQIRSSTIGEDLPGKSALSPGLEAAFRELMATVEAQLPTSTGPSTGPFAGLRLPNAVASWTEGKVASRGALAPDALWASVPTHANPPLGAATLGYAHASVLDKLGLKPD